MTWINVTTRLIRIMALFLNNAQERIHIEIQTQPK